MGATPMPIAGGGAGVAAGEFIWHLNLSHLVAGTAIAAGAAVLPDIDHPDASCARSFGFVTEAFAWLIEHVSGGHRHAAHLVGDILTNEGIPIAWPLSRFHVRLLPEPFAFTTGTRPERWVVAPALLAALLWLTWLAALAPRIVPGRRVTLR